MPSPYVALIFDLDGTLVDSYEPITESLNVVRTSMGLPPKLLEQVRREVGRGLESLIADNVGPDRTEEGVRLFRIHYRKVFRHATRLLPGVGPVLLELGRRRIPMAITSNKPAYFSREIVETLGFGESFLAILGPEMVEHPKPDPEMIHRAVEALSRPASEILYVGDMRIDIEASRRAKVAVCVIPSGSDTKAELSAARPDFLIETFEDLLGLVSSGC